MLPACQTEGEQDPSVRPADRPVPATEAPIHPATIDVEAPDFSLETLHGDTFTLSDYRDRIVVPNFWATWCPPCRIEIPDFMALHDSLGDDVIFAGVSVDEGGWGDVRPFADELSINYPIMVDDGSVAEAYGPLAVLPTSYIIDRNRRLAYYVPGMVNRADLESVLLNMLKNPERQGEACYSVDPH